jgi:hypothetical protein
MRRGRETSSALLAVTVVALLVRLPLLERQALWPDEVFSLAIATGHSLEHPASLAQPALGDFVEPAQPQEPARYRRYLEHQVPGGGLGRVLRAVRLSDTSPPLYYLLLALWTRVAGTSDAALRAFSLLASLACLPLLWRVAAALGGRRAGLLSCGLFALAPAAVYYSTEGRMYALVWLWVLAGAWLALRLRRQGPRPGLLLALTLVSAAGLLTHYFFVFFWAVLIGWLQLRADPRHRRGILLAAGLAVLLVLPWYAGVPEDVGRWRVTGNWLRMRPEGHVPARAPLQAALGFVSGRGVWGGGPREDRSALVIAALATGALAWKRGSRLLSGRPQLLLLWLAAACGGPLLFDTLRGTFTAAVPRYALAGLPAALALVGLALGRLPARLGWAGLALVLVSWAPGLRAIARNGSRNGAALAEAARELGGRAHAESDLILVHSIPSGLLGLARYMEAPVPMASWVGQLGTRRVPESVRTLTAGRRVTFLVVAHAVGEPAPEQAYLERHARLVRDDWREAVRIVEFRHSERR